MASVIRKRAIQFTNKDGERKTIGLGRLGLTQRQFDSVVLRVDKLVSAQVSGHAIDQETAAWVAELGSRLAEKLADVGLIPRPQTATLQAFLDAYVKSRADVKGATQIVYGHTRRCLIEFFGQDKPLREITPGDADDWRLWLVNHENLADNTVRRRSAIAKQYFKAALRKGLVSMNPFADLPGSVRQNKERMVFVSRATIQRVIDASPDAEWRLIWALSRYGGLRCPSEHLALRWANIDWDRGRMNVHSPKTEHHPGGESRLVPIFPELRPYLEDAFHLLQPGGSEFVISRYRDPYGNLRQYAGKIITRAGVTPWPKPFHNLRASRETELTADWPLHVVCAWIGNSQLIAAKHYLSVTDEHFEQAAKQPTSSESAARALKQASAGDCSEAQTPGNEDQETASCGPLQSVAASCSDSTYEEVGDTGLEPVTPCL